MKLNFLQQDIIEQLIFGNQQGENAPISALAIEINADLDLVRGELYELLRRGLVDRYPWRYTGKVSEFFNYTQNGGMSDGING